MSKRERRESMPREQMEEHWPSLRHLAGPLPKASQYAWLAAFTANPESMHRILQDLIKQAYAIPGRTGQRPMPKEEDVDLFGLVYGEDNDLPLTELLPKMVNVSERAFCERIHMSRSQYQRMLRGQYHPDAAELRLIASALQRPPTFLVEYRQIMAVSAFIQLIEDRPGIATRLYRDYLSVRAEAAGVAV